MTKFYEIQTERQGRPSSDMVLDLDTHKTVSPSGSTLHAGDVDDAPVDGATTAPISSNWAYSHVTIQDYHMTIMARALSTLLKMVLENDMLDNLDIDIDETIEVLGDLGAPLE